jgi:glycosyltransferase involved in cell wall biosynthesis
LLVCSGLDHARRGYESFARECFEALRKDPGVEIELVKGSGPAGPGERSIPAMRRDGAIAQKLGRAFDFRPFRLEALAFAFSLQPLLLRRRPDVVYLSEWDTASTLARLRQHTSQRFKLVLCNGGFAVGGFEHLDRVQELTPAARAHVLELGADPARHTVLPYGFGIGAKLAVLSAGDRSALRRRLGLPAERTIVVSVAALNRSHKRLDYLIEEIAAVPAPRPFALMVGEPDAETPALRALAEERLGADGHEFRTVPANRVPELLRASDAFVLTSLAEAQGRAVIEAMAEGLRCIVHESPVMRFAVGEHGSVADLRERGALTRLLARDGLEELDQPAAHARHRYAYDRFSWERLRPRYVELLSDVARGESANRTVSSSIGEKLAR